MKSHFNIKEDFVKIFSKLIVVCAFLALSASSQTIDNIQFKDMDGKSYDLYELLNEGKHVFLEMIWNG